MSRGILELIVLGTVCSLALLATTVGQTIAATKKAKELAPALVEMATPPNSKPSQKPVRLRPMKSGDSLAVLERQPEAVQKEVQQGPTKPKLPSAKSHRRVKVTKKVAPKAVVQPRTDLMYHGMLESPQRYNPRRNHPGAGILDSNNPELTHDHFQELDRNQDGTIDPVERTFGRLDMDRDFHDRQPR